MMELYVKDGWELSKNAPKIIRLVQKCGGYCPCGTNKLEGEEKKCPCADYRIRNICHCNLYIKKDD